MPMINQPVMTMTKKSKRVTAIFGKRSERNPHALFETPDSVVEEMFEFCDLPSGEQYTFDLLEPGAGTGQIARPLRSRLPNCQLDVFEIDEVSQQELIGDGFDVVGTDFLKDPAPRRYDFVLMNPPFNGDSYVDHCLKAFDLLKPHGIVVSVVPEAFLWHSTKKVRQFRHLVAEMGDWTCIGTPFEYTPLTCYLVKLERLSAERLRQMWANENGFESVFQESAEIALSCCEDWYRSFWEIAKQPQHEWRKLLEPRLDAEMQRLIHKEGHCLLYDDRVKAQLMRSLLQELKDEAEYDVSETAAIEATTAPSNAPEAAPTSLPAGQLSLF